MSSMPSLLKQHAFSLLALTILVAGEILGPIHQPANYHHFADQSMLWGIPHSMDVLSNLGFLIVGMWGCIAQRQQAQTDLAWRICFLSLIATAFGSCYYHLQPDDARLFWDRLPITITCTSLITASLPTHRHAWLSLMIGMIYAVLSLIWWQQTGDLKYYLGVQLLALIWLPLSTYLSGNRQALAWAGFTTIGYLVAKWCEWQDLMIFQLLGFSGHSLKHIIASIATIGLVKLYLSRSLAIPRSRSAHTAKEIHVS